MRTLLLFLSRQRQLRRLMETSPLARRLASRFVAGDTLTDALNVGRRLNAEGFFLTLDHLGENVTTISEAALSRDAYLRALEALGEQHIQANVSIKLTQFGMDLAEEICRENVEQVVRGAAELESFVRIDMESSAYTDRTLRLVTALHEKFGSVGTVIQAYLRRSEADVEMLCEKGIRVRLCKGAYLESASVAFHRKSEVDRNFLRLMRILLDKGVYPAIATHDERMIGQTKAYAQAHGIGRDCFEFQMLYGIRRDIQRRLVNDGFRLRLYVPFGKAWYPYFMRRLAERPANLLFLARNLFRK